MVQLRSKMENTARLQKTKAQSEWGLGELGAEAPVFDEVFHML